MGSIRCKTEPCITVGRCSNPKVRPAKRVSYSEGRAGNVEKAIEKALVAITRGVVNVYVHIQEPVYHTHTQPTTQVVAECAGTHIQAKG